MEMLRTFWPTLIGGILILYLLAVLVLRKSAKGRLLDRNREGILLLGSCFLLFLLLLGAQIALSRSLGEIGDFRRSAGRNLESAKSGSRDWSIRYGILEAERDSLRKRTASRFLFAARCLPATVAPRWAAPWFSSAATTRPGMSGRGKSP